ncbi:hypothetical protein DPEC_G00297870 [Dallia pectoralis]|uniref:Uncharacterized protein n=1 Tax=Dallia pectoralis TaxID=75939 RepID=A0ACC2FFT3_DALPE|nr:hypothetical protein DPEC_G00297870 [Dallia pectoralis]
MPDSVPFQRSGCTSLLTLSVSQPIISSSPSLSHCIERQVGDGEREREWPWQISLRLPSSPFIALSPSSSHSLLLPAKFQREPGTRRSFSKAIGTGELLCAV